MKKIHQSKLVWEPAAHEDPEDPGVLKKVIVSHVDVDPRSKLMMINVCRVPIGKTHNAHSHATMEEIFFFENGIGEVRVEDEIEEVKAGDRIIVPANSIHQIKNTGNVELEYIAVGIALD